MSEDKPPLFFISRLRARIVGVGAAVTLARCEGRASPDQLDRLHLYGLNHDHVGPAGWLAASNRQGIMTWHFGGCRGGWAGGS